MTNLFRLFGGKDMSQVAEMTHRYPIYLHKVRGIFTPDAAFFIIMEGGHADNEDATDFILSGAGNRFRLARNGLNIIMGRVLMTDRDDAGGELAQGVAYVWGIRVSNNGDLAALYPEARMTQPGNLHKPNIAQVSLTVKENELLNPDVLGESSP